MIHLFYLIHQNVLSQPSDVQEGLSGARLLTAACPGVDAIASQGLTLPQFLPG